MSMAGSFLGGAKNRLLPVSIPFRFFLAAAGFHVLAWAVLFFGASDLAGFIGGTGPVLAAIHLLTLGVLAMTAMGASYQLLPVVTRQPLARTWPARLSFWAMTPGVAILALGMATTNQLAMITGGTLVGAGLLVFAVLTAINLSRATSMPVVAAHGWGALVALLGFVGLAAVLIVDFDLGLLPDHAGVATIHMMLASFGFMGLLVLGLSQVLIPMFVLSYSLPARVGWFQLGLALGGILFSGLGLWTQNNGLILVGFLCGIGAGVAHFLLMRGAFKTSMRKRLGLSFILIRVSWAMLGLGLLIGLGLTLGVPVPNGTALFGFVVLVGWLLTFLTGILQRIMPFLASMHASGRSGVPPLLSDLTAETPLRIHAIGHFTALPLIGVGIVFDWSIAVQIGAVSGFLGALGFGAFAIYVVINLNAIPDKS